MDRLTTLFLEANRLEERLGVMNFEVIVAWQHYEDELERQELLARQELDR